MLCVTGGNGSVNISFCKIPGCAANVTKVFCNDKLLFNSGGIKKCTGPPPPRSVCQHDGRAFVSTDADAVCEFEGKDGYIETGKCKGIYFYFQNPCKY